jgi:uncharacterized coiled-coil DUF342 family protein
MMDVGATRGEYRLLETRPRLLARFFEESRDNWKRKCQAAVAEVKQFRDQVRDVRQSRQMWREQAEQARQEQQRLAAEVQRLRVELAAATAPVGKKVSAAR